jgi:SP family general alpha glucoside:H+ symporter-like MFS transporter
MGGLAFMFVCLIAIGGLGFAKSDQASLAVGILLVISTLCNMITVGPVCYPIVAETPSGRLRYKTIVIGRVVYNLTGIFSNSVTPRMISATSWGWGAKAGFFYAGTNLLCLAWCYFRLPETKDRTFGEIDILFENKVPARKFKYTKADRECCFSSSTRTAFRLSLMSSSEFVQSDDQRLEESKGERKTEVDHSEFA